jgi:type VI secretion system protein ImpD/type VI secretion system protein ImpC
MSETGAPETSQPLRDAVLSGRFFTRARAREADELSSFLDPRLPLPFAAWFGADRAVRLLSDPDAMRSALDRDIAAIDALMGAQVDAILHHRRLQALEGAWRGLAWLVGGVETGSKVKIRLLAVTWPEICRDLERAAEFDASQMFRKIYEDEFGTPGGEPFGLLVINHEIRHRPGDGVMTDDIGALTALAGVAAAAFVPTVLGVSPALLDVDTFADLAGVVDPVSPLRDMLHQRWRSLSAMEDSRFLALVLPRLLARPPWEDDPGRKDNFRYREYAPNAASRVWMSAGFAFAAVATRAYAAFGWPADVRGVEPDSESGGLVTEMPLEPYATDPGHSWVRHPLEIQLTDRQERAFVDAGLVPLTPLPFGEDGVFCSVPSVQAPRHFIGATAAVAEANSRISAQIGAMLCVSRFAHCVKMMGREMVGSFRTNDEIESSLQAWVSKYINANLQAGPDMRARFPLVAGTVSVRERPGRPGVFGCTVHLQPHYQLDNVSASFRLMTEIAAPGRAA